MTDADLKRLASTQLVALWREGRRDAAGELWDRYSQDLLKYVRVHLWQAGRPGADPQSILNSGFGSALRTLSERTVGFADDRHVFFWIRQLIGWKLQKRRRIRTEETYEPQLADVLTKGPTSGHVEDFSDLWQRFVEYVEKLPEADRELFRLTLEGLVQTEKGFSQQELAQRLGVSDRHIRRRWAAARQVLRKQLGGTGDG